MKVQGDIGNILDVRTGKDVVLMYVEQLGAHLLGDR
jgi:hypothetical protein